MQRRLNPARTVGLERFPRFSELVEVADRGAIPHFKPGFRCNRGEGDFFRSQARQLRAAIRHQYGKLHRRGWCIILPKDMVEGMEGLHVSPAHVACKRGDTKGRCCVDHSASGLNEGTDMETIKESLGQLLSLPGLQELATLLHNAYQRGARCMFKTDVSSAFNRIKLSHDAVLSQATRVDNLILLPLVAVFGWTASPIYYSLVSDAVSWAHNGGVTGLTLDGWRRDQGNEVPLRPHSSDERGRSITYVDDTLGPVMPDEEVVTPADADTIICKLLGNDGVNSDKDAFGARLTGLGWFIEMTLGTMRLPKMFRWCVRKCLNLFQSMSCSHWCRCCVGIQR
jgi:hypothetical protein